MSKTRKAFAICGAAVCLPVAGAMAGAALGVGVTATVAILIFPATTGAIVLAAQEGTLGMLSGTFALGGATIGAAVGTWNGVRAATAFAIRVVKEPAATANRPARTIRAIMADTLSS